MKIHRKRYELLQRDVSFREIGARIELQYRKRYELLQRRF